MQAIGMRTMARRIVRFGRDRKMRPYRAAPEVFAEVDPDYWTGR